MLNRSNAASLLAVISCALPALALAGTLEQIKKSGEIRIGYRTDAPPLAFNDASGQAAGYSVDLCKRIATAVKEELKLADLKVTFVPLTSADRLDAIVKNKADIECGATTITLSRAEKVDFTLMTFVTGGGLLSLADSNVNALADVAGKSVAWSSPAQPRRPRSRQTLTRKPDRCQGGARCESRGGMKQLDARQVVAFASDQIVLIGQVIHGRDPGSTAWRVSCFPTSPMPSS